MQPQSPAPPHPPSGPGACSSQPGPGAARPDFPTEDPDSPSGSAMGTGREPFGLSPTALSRDSTGNSRGRDGAEIGQRTTTPSSQRGRIQAFAQPAATPFLSKEKQTGPGLRVPKCPAPVAMLIKGARKMWERVESCSPYEDSDWSWCGTGATCE